MPRKKLPAYGKRLLDERSAGKHPLEVTVVYGDRGFDVAEPKLWIKPSEFEPGKYDFRMLAGVHVLVVDQLGESAEFDESARPPTFGKFYDLLAEVAAADAWVTVRYPPQFGAGDRELQELATTARWFDRDLRAMQWPRWWSDELEVKHLRRWSNWHLHDAYERGILERERGKAA